MQESGSSVAAGLRRRRLHPESVQSDIAATAGHNAFSTTLHATDATSTIEEVEDVVDEEHRELSREAVNSNAADTPLRPPRPTAAIPTAPMEQQQPQQRPRTTTIRNPPTAGSSASSPRRLARLYCLISFGVALAAVVIPNHNNIATTTTTKSPTSTLSSSSPANQKSLVHSPPSPSGSSSAASTASPGTGGTGTNAVITTNEPSFSSMGKSTGVASTKLSHVRPLAGWFEWLPFQSQQLALEPSEQQQQPHPQQPLPPNQQRQQQPKQENWWLDLLSLWKHIIEEEMRVQESKPPQPSGWGFKSKPASAKPVRIRQRWKSLYAQLKTKENWIDPILLQRPLSPTTLTDLLDKILTSTLRLLALANLLLSWTYLLHGAVVDWFLTSTMTQSSSDASQQQQQQQFTFVGGILQAVPDEAFAVHAQPAATHRPQQQQPSRQQPPPQHKLFCGYLFFKMLLASAIVAPDTLDWMILLSWYTLLSFLRSLCHTCSLVTQRTGILSGIVQPPAGVWHLLVVILMSDILAAALCVALFHGAGWSMVVLLTCDCLLLGVNVICCLLEYGVQYLEAQHVQQIQALEQQNISPVESPAQPNDLHTNAPNQAEGMFLPVFPPSPPPSPTRMNNNTSRTQRVEILERQHARRLQILESTIFALKLMVQILTAAHFVHIWSLHGFQFTLIDGVLAAQLHNAFTDAAKKIKERRHLYRIARDLDGMFVNATPLELGKAADAGDVCCICLNSMSVNVKKLPCGHLYHTSCLREVVERARSVEAARCPLCRASVLDGSRNHQRLRSSVQIAGPRGIHGANVQNTAAHPVEATGPLQPAAEVVPPHAPVAANDLAFAERALFRFSTAEIFPDWLPLPAFAFEIVRRPIPAAALLQQPQPPLVPQGEQLNQPPRQNQNQPQPEQILPPAQQPSLFQQLLILAGVIVPLTPEQEALALDQLVDMFPQYDRSDLLRSLRMLGSSERVAESILAGLFFGSPRGQFALNGQQ